MKCAPVNYIHHDCWHQPHPWSLCVAAPTRHHVTCSRLSDGGKEGNILGQKHGGLAKRDGGRGEPVVVLFKSPFWCTSSRYTLLLISFHRVPMKWNVMFLFAVWLSKREYQICISNVTETYLIHISSLDKNKRMCPKCLLPGENALSHYPSDWIVW